MLRHRCFEYNPNRVVSLVHHVHGVHDQVLYGCNIQAIMVAESIGIVQDHCCNGLANTHYNEGK